MKPGETRQDRLKRQAAEKEAKRKPVELGEWAATPDPKRRPGHSRRPEWTLGRKKR